MIETNSLAIPRSIEARLEDVMRHLRRSYDVALGDIRVVSVPLRICPLGAHIDHQLGVVTGMAIDQPVLLAFAPAEDGAVSLESTGFAGRVEFTLDDIPPLVRGEWGNYPRGAAQAMLAAHGIEHGFVGVIDSDMPVGGLSSSAAVSIAYLTALQTVNELDISPMELVDLVTATEHTYIGLNNGILDQTSILFSRKNRLTRIDCATRAVDQIETPLGDDDLAVLIVYSGVTMGLVGSGYNRRVAECAEAATLLLEAGGGTPKPQPRLRDVDPALFDAYGAHLPDHLRRRAAHYFGEMARVEQGLAAWNRGDRAQFGRLVSESGASSVNNYECGSPELITLYEILAGAPGVCGARFSGAGFRGNCIALVPPRAAETVADVVHALYPARHPAIRDCYSVHICRSADGAKLIL